MKTALLTTLAVILLPSQPALSSEPEELNFGILAGFDYEEGMELPEEVSKLNGKQVSVSGFMATEDGSEGDVEYFIIINDACGCEGTPKMNEMIFCIMPEGETTKLKDGRVTVVGKFHVSEEMEEGVVVSLYGLEVDSVK